jgi:hypothetical protein
MTFLLVLSLIAQTPSPDCSDWRDCRTKALEAASQKEFETFHDLAWRAAQKGPPRDPDLMYLVARAQALSGRPADALVMLRRLAEMNIPTDAISSAEFERVRELPGWADVAALLEGRKPAPAAEAPAAPAAEPATPGAAPGPSTGGPAPAAPNAVEDALRFDAISFVAAGLGYDAVSRRFVVGNRDARKIFVVDEGSRRANDLVGAASAGFYAITGLDIDPRRGDLWVVSVEEGQPGAAAAHRLQLVSGRLLETLAVPADLLPVRFADVAVTADGAVLALDAAGRRIFRARFGGHALEVAATLDLNEPTSLAPVNAAAVYVAHAGGLVSVDLASKRASEVTAQDPIDLSGLERIRARGDSLVAVQRGGNSRRIIRLALNSRGTRVVSSKTLDAAAPASAANAATVAGDAFYYLSVGASGEKVVKRVSLR